MTLRRIVDARLAELRRRMQPDPARPPRVWMRERWRSLLALALAIVAVGVLDVWLASCGFTGCPTSGEIRAYRPAEGGDILDRNGRLLGRVADVHRINVPLRKVPRHVQHAFLATEDRRFYRHNGLDWRGLARAVVRNVAAGGIREGFSTLTMQVARNTFVANRYGSRTLRRKLMELRLAGLLERTLTKDQIFELYLNVIYLGNGTYGVEAASRELFGKGVERLGVHEGAMLAALPKGPSSYNPRRDRRRALRRRNLVVAMMLREKYLDRAEAVAAAQRPLVVSPTSFRHARTEDSYALDAVRAVVDSVLSDNMEGADLVVYTTLDATAQRAAERVVRQHASAIERQSREWYGGRDDVQAALVALDPRTGDIRALVGGRRYERGGFNRALAARRQPGSAFKPFVYAAALAAGFGPASMVDDEPIEIREDGQLWRPANYDDRYEGRISLRRALMRSANAATVRVSRAVGESRVAALARRNGIESDLAPVPAIALGALEVTPLELATGYAPFANGGQRVVPRLVRRIEAADGTVLWSSETASTPVMDPRDAYLVTSMLRSAVEHGTGRAVREAGVRGPVAGKTGTTNNGSDVWFVGYTPTLVAAVWFGYDAPRPLIGNATAGRLAAPAWADFYREGWREERGAAGAWNPPEGMTPAVIDAQSGELATEWCPITQEEWFKPGTEPLSPCQLHGPPEDEGDEPWVSSVADKIGKQIERAFRRMLPF